MQYCVIKYQEYNGLTSNLESFQIGSIPVYYGAPNVAEWLPNEYSAVQINEFSSPKKLAEHLHYLHNNDEDYLAHLFHKPSINQNALTLISNENLVRLMAQRSWGVSDQAQLDKGKQYY